MLEVGTLVTLSEDYSISKRKYGHLWVVATWEEAWGQWEDSKKCKYDDETPIKSLATGNIFRVPTHILISAQGAVT